MALAEASRSHDGPSDRGAGPWTLLSLGAVPPPALILLGIISVQVGAGLAKHLFGQMAPGAVVLLRLATSAIVLGVLGRKALRAVPRSHSRRDLLVVTAFGLTLAFMNFSFYQALTRIPLGLAVSIEFLGPLTIAIAASRRWLDLLWAVLAMAGVVLLAGGGSLNTLGILFALLAGAGWAAYILLSAATGRRFSGSTGLAIASTVGAVALLPIGVTSGGSALLSPRLLLIGLGVGLLSSLIPYTLELEALRRVPARVFGILMSLEPAVAAVVGLVILGEVLSLTEWTAVGCIIVACLGSTRFQKEPSETPEA
jgi:inner membrane transporter RhtA